MKKFKVVTGYYPSFNSAEKVKTRVNEKLKNIKLDDVKAEVVQFSDCYIVLLYQTNDYDRADAVFSKCMNNKIYCGIDCSEAEL